ncbi:MAG TPA: ABC transporter ATP-binding protein [Actinobacteria bacterium]|nr:ABC transporter ATP-binding protein [Actinomycetota bacterium]
MTAKTMTRDGRSGLHDALSRLPGWVWWALAIVIAGVFPLLNVAGLVETAWLRVGVISLIFVMLSLGLNIVMGETGLLNLGYIAFFAFGAYTTALLSSPKFGLQWPFLAVLALSALVAMVAGFLISVPTLRLRGDYLAIVTLAFGEIVRLTITNLVPLTNGPNGITGIYPPALSSSADRGAGGLAAWLVIDKPVEYYYLVLVCVIVLAVLLTNLKNSRIGRAWNALREDELAAVSAGITASRAKMLAVVLSAGIAGFAGSLFAYYSNVISPESFLFMQSVIVVCMVVLGGMGSIPGVVIGAIVLQALPQIIRQAAGAARSDFEVYRMLIYGILIVVMVIFRPEGLIPDKIFRYESHEVDPRELERTRQSLFDLEEGEKDLEV